eukprot:TRINITY_DN3808_c0_g1_i1.p2 TRINITY_DN3808_c0_g1~~TRINITY_DN3808_c0_g1_i1.p2  ORF type:complete len:144 (-),score=50.21 TRINITY_DN3808_c0_g1_i1:25-456(-)
MSTQQDLSTLSAAERIKQLKKVQGNARTGGKGSVRRKKKVQRKAQGNDEKKIQSALKGLGLNPIPGIDQVDLIKDDGSVLIFKNPRLQAAPNANTYIITGTPETKTLRDLFPDFPVNAAADEEIPDLVGGDVNFEQVATGDAQ